MELTVQVFLSCSISDKSRFSVIATTYIILAYWVLCSQFVTRMLIVDNDNLSIFETVLGNADRIFRDVPFCSCIGCRFMISYALITNDRGGSVQLPVPGTGADYPLWTTYPEVF